MTDLEKSGRTKGNKVDGNDEDNIALLPIDDIEKVTSFEKKIKNKEFYKQVVCILFKFYNLL